MRSVADTGLPLMVCMTCFLYSLEGIPLMYKLQERLQLSTRAPRNANGAVGYTVVVEGSPMKNVDQENVSLEVEEFMTLKKPLFLK